MPKKEKEDAIRNADSLNETTLYEHISKIIENRKAHASAYANREVTLMFWEVGRYINSVILDFKRAAYGKGIFSTLSRKLVEKYGKSFQEENLYRMTQFANVFSNATVLEELLMGLSWSHICELIRIKNEEARIFYANLSERMVKTPLSALSYARKRAGIR
jgi:hypothetical protein